MENIILIGWILSIYCLFGDYFCNKKKKICWVIWLIGNICFMGIDLYYGQYGRIFLGTIQSWFCITGWIRWNRKPRRGRPRKFKGIKKLFAMLIN